MRKLLLFTALLLIGVAANATITFTFVQASNYCIRSTSLATTYTCVSPTLTTGDMIVVFTGARGGMASATISSVTDNASGGSNTYAVNKQANNATGASLAAIATAPVTHGSGGTVTVTVTFSALPTTQQYVAVGDLQDTSLTFTSGSVDGNCSGTNSATTSISCSSQLSSFVSANEYVFATVMGNASQTWTAGTGFTVNAPTGTNAALVESGQFTANLTPSATTAANDSGTIVSIGITVSSGGGNFTATQNGDWNTPATWGKVASTGCHVDHPCSTDAGGPGDIVTIPANLSITCTGTNEVCSGGDSRANNSLCIQTSSAGGNNGSLEIGSTATFVYACSMELAFGSLILDAGAKVYGDNTWVTGAPNPFYYVELDNGTVFSTWAANGTSGSHITWDGDGCDGPRGNSNCSTTCASHACLATALEYSCNGTSPSLTSGGTSSYIDFSNFIGCTQGSNKPAFYAATNNSTSITLSNVSFTNTDAIYMRLVGAVTGTITVNGLKITNSRATNTNAGELIYESSGVTGTGTASISNLVVDEPITTLLGSGLWSFDNVFLYGTPTNGWTSGQMGVNSVDNGPWSEVLHLQGAYNSGTNPTFSIDHFPYNSTYSVGFLNATVNNHRRNFNILETATGTSGSFTSSTNFIGAVGTVGASTSQGVTSVQGPAPSTSSFTWKNNVIGCGYDGQGVMNSFGAYLQGGTYVNDTMSISANTICNTLGSVDQPSPGSPAVETATTTPALSTGVVTSIDTNLFFCAMTSTCNQAGIWGPFNTSTVGTNTFGFIGNNAVVNVGTWTQIASDYQGTAPTSKVNCINNANCGSDVQKTYAPRMIEPLRSLPLFDVEYLIPAGILSATVYTGASQFKGAWANSTAYSAGDIVSFQNSGVWNNVTTYWRARQGHTSSSLNEPVLGVDASNPQLGWTPDWEEAVVQSWLIPATFAGTDYTANCRALIGPTCRSTTHAIGLLNTWLRQGYVSYDSSLWSACNGAECGANPMPMSQHITPPVVMP